MARASDVLQDLTNLIRQGEEKDLERKKARANIDFTKVIARLANFVLTKRDIQSAFEKHVPDWDIEWVEDCPNGGWGGNLLVWAQDDNGLDSTMRPYEDMVNEIKECTDLASPMKMQFVTRNLPTGMQDTLLYYTFAEQPTKKQKLDFFEVDLSDCDRPVPHTSYGKLNVTVEAVEGATCLYNKEYVSTVVDIAFDDESFKNFDVYLAIGGREFSHRGPCFSSHFEIPCEARWKKDSLRIRFVAKA